MLVLVLVLVVDRSGWRALRQWQFGHYTQSTAWYALNAIIDCHTKSDTLPLSLGSFTPRQTDDDVFTPGSLSLSLSLSLSSLSLSQAVTMRATAATDRTGIEQIISRGRTGMMRRRSTALCW